MPLYEFICSACGSAFEEICPQDGEPPLCPHCGKSGAERQISRPSPLKTGAFPFPPTGQVHPLAKSMAGACEPCSGNCASLE